MKIQRHIAISLKDSLYGAGLVTAIVGAIVYFPVVLTLLLLATAGFIKLRHEQTFDPYRLLAYVIVPMWIVIDDVFLPGRRDSYRHVYFAVYAMLVVIVTLRTAQLIKRKGAKK